MSFSDVISSLALLVSCGSLYYAHMSMNEAKRSVTLSQADMLSEHFSNVDFLWELVIKQEGSYKVIEAGKRSLDALRSHLHRDKIFLSSIQHLEEWANDASQPRIFVVGEPLNDDDFFKTPNEAHRAYKNYLNKKNQYIGVSKP